MLRELGDQAERVAEQALGPVALRESAVMNEAMRHEIVQRRQAGRVGPVDRDGVGHFTRRGRSRPGAGRRRSVEGPSASGFPPQQRRGRILDEYEPILKELLAQRYPNLTVERALQELQARGFTGRLHDGPRTGHAPAAAGRAGARAALRDRARHASPDGLRRLRHRLHA